MESLEEILSEDNLSLLKEKLKEVKVKNGEERTLRELGDAYYVLSLQGVKLEETRDEVEGTLARGGYNIITREGPPTLDRILYLLDTFLGKPHHPQPDAFEKFLSGLGKKKEEKKNGKKEEKEREGATLDELRRRDEEWVADQKNRDGRLEEMAHERGEEAGGTDWGQEYVRESGKLLAEREQRLADWLAESWQKLDEWRGIQESRTADAIRERNEQLIAFLANRRAALQAFLRQEPPEEQLLIEERHLDKKSYATDTCTAKTLNQADSDLRKSWKDVFERDPIETEQFLTKRHSELKTFSERRQRRLKELLSAKSSAMINLINERAKSKILEEKRRDREWEEFNWEWGPRWKEGRDWGWEGQSEGHGEGGTELTRAGFLAALRLAEEIGAFKQEHNPSHAIVPWEEAEFALIAYLASYTEGDPVFSSVLDDARVRSHFIAFRRHIKSARAVLENRGGGYPSRVRPSTLERMDGFYPSLKPLLKDYSILKDIYSLRRCVRYLDSGVESGLAVERTLQVLGESIKNSYMSPNLSEQSRFLLFRGQLRGDLQALRDLISHSPKHDLSLERLDGVLPLLHIVSHRLRIVLLYRYLDALDLFLEKIARAETLKQIIYTIRPVDINLFIKTLRFYQKIEISGNFMDVVIKLGPYFFHFANSEKLIPQIENYLGGLFRVKRGLWNEKEEIQKAATQMKSTLAKYSQSNWLVMPISFIGQLFNNDFPLHYLNNDIGAEKSKDPTHLSKNKTCNKTYDPTILDEELEQFPKSKTRYFELMNILETKVPNYKYMELVDYFQKNRGELVAIEMVLLKLTEDDKSFQLSQRVGLVTTFYQGKSLRNYLAHGDKIQMVNSAEDVKRISHVVTLIKDGTQLSKMIEVKANFEQDLKTAARHRELERAVLEDDRVTAELLITEGASKVGTNMSGKDLMDIVISKDFPRDNGREWFLKLAPQMDKGDKTYRRLLCSAAEQDSIESLICLLEYPSKGDREGGANRSVEEATVRGAREGKKRAVEVLLSRGAKVDGRDEADRTPLVGAAEGGHEELADLLVEKGASLEEEWKGDWRPIHVAALHGHLTFIQALLRLGAEKEPTTRDGLTPFLIALLVGHPPLICHLLPKGGFPPKYLLHLVATFLPTPHSVLFLPSHYQFQFPTDDEEGWALIRHNPKVMDKMFTREIFKLFMKTSTKLSRSLILFYCIMSHEEDQDMVESLLNKGVYEDLILSPLLLAAAMVGNVECLRTLLRWKTDLHLHHVFGIGGLHVAALFGQKPVIRILASAGAELEQPCSLFGLTPLGCAAGIGDIASVRLLLELGAKVDPQPLPLQDSTPDILLLWIGSFFGVKFAPVEYRSPVWAASTCGHRDIVQLLADEGANLDWADQEGCTPLFQAANYGHDAVVTLLAEKKANLDCMTKSELTPLAIACLSGYTWVIKSLIENGADITLLNPLHRAARNGHDSVVSCLLSYYSKKKIPIDTKDENNKTALQWASMRGHVNVVTALLKKGATLDTFDDEGQNPLHNAVVAGHEEVVRILLKDWADVNGLSKGGCSPLYIACREGRLEVVKVLVEEGAIVDQPDILGEPPVTIAARRGHDQVVAYLLQHIPQFKLMEESVFNPLPHALVAGHMKVVNVLLANGTKFDLEGKDDWSPLHVAAYTEQILPTIFLLESFHMLGLDINLGNKYGRTPLFLAASVGNIGIVRALVEGGARCDIGDNNGWTPLHEAVYRDKETVVQLLIELGADVNALSKRKVSPLHVASSKGNTNIIQILIKHKAEINYADDIKLSCLHKAVWAGLTTVKCLLSAGAAPNPRDDVGFTPLCYASLLEQYEMVKTLAEEGGLVNMADSIGQTPLHRTSWAGKEKMVRLLLELGAEVEAADNDGRTPLHHAAMKGHTLTVEALLEGGARRGRRTPDGETALFLACEGGHEGTVRALLDRGSDPNEEGNWEGLRALSVSADEGHREIVRVLLEAGAEIDWRTETGESALWLAAEEGELRVVEELASWGADLESADSELWTPLHVAAYNGQSSVVRFLLEAQVSLQPRTSQGHTPLDLAHPTVAHLLHTPPKQIN